MCTEINGWVIYIWKEGKFKALTFTDIALCNICTYKRILWSGIGITALRTNFHEYNKYK